jgi:PilZ domain
MQRMNGWAPRKDRFPVEIDAVVLRPDGSKLAVRLTDFSDQGCRVETDDEFSIGEKLQIAVSRMGNVKAQVRWVQPGSVGTRFLTESDF